MGWALRDAKGFSGKKNSARFVSAHNRCDFLKNFGPPKKDG
jgi:hypothetical protein